MPDDGWATFRLNQVLDRIIDYRGKQPRKVIAGVQLITAKNIRDGHLDLKVCQEFIAEGDYDAWMVRGMPHSGDLLFTTEAPLGNVALFPVRGKYALAQRVVVLRANKHLACNEYLMHWFRSPMGQTELQRLATGSTAKGIKQSTLRKMAMMLPSPTTQRALAPLLSAWDTQMLATQRLLKARRKMKRGLLQQMLTGQRRFPDFHQQRWVERRLGDIVTRVTRTNTGGSTHALTISGRDGFVDQRKFFSKLIAGESIGDSYLIKSGEFAYNRSLMKGYPFGATKRLDTFAEGVVSKLYVVFAISDPEVESDFLVHLFEAGVLNRQLCRITNLGARAHGLLNVVTDDFFNLRVMMPSRQEQRRIAETLSTLDHEIDLLKQQLTAIKDQKRGLMQKLLTGKVRVPASMLKEAAHA